jgi:hypothetical protein
VTLTQALYVRVATPRQAAVTTWGLRQAASAVGGVVAYRGLDGRGPLLGSSGVARRNVARILAPSLRTPAQQALVVGFFGHSAAHRGTLSNSRLRLQIATRRAPHGASAIVGDHVTRAAGPTGRRFASLPRRAACTVGQQLALRPSAVAAFPGAPVSTSPPTISGTAASGQRLTASPGSWTPAAASVAYRWRRCDGGGDACSDIAGADGDGYTATGADVGHRLRVAVTATNAAGSATAVSGPTAVVVGSTGPAPPAPPPPVPIPVPPPLPPPAGSVVLVDQSWTCRGPVNIPLVRVTMRTARADAIHLREDCSGRIGRIEIDTWTTDGLKINAPAPAAHDLVIEGGYIRCHDHVPNAHQDGIQAMGGTRIRLVGLELNCNSEPNAQLFLAAANGGRPTDVVCEGCFFGSGAGSSLFIATSTRSGARNSQICPGRFSPIRIQDADDPVNVGNTVLPASDPRC